MYRKIAIFTGHFGSGKSEIAINLALNHLRAEKEVYFIDLDIVKPYFRSRMVRNYLLNAGVHMIIPTGEHVYADLPIVMPQIKTILEKPQGQIFLDIAGDADGCRVLSSFYDIIQHADYELLLVVNTARPRTEGIKGNQRILEEIEAMSRLKVAGIIANTHLMDETTEEIVVEGYKTTEAFARHVNLPVKMVVAKKEIAVKLDPSQFSCPILPIDTYIKPPFAKDAGSLTRPRSVV